MRARETHFNVVDINYKAFETMEDAVKKANALKRFLEYTCKSRGYSCIAVIGVSSSNTHDGQVVACKYGRKEFKANEDGYINEVTPHIHITLISNPSRSLAIELEEHINKKYSQKVTWRKKCDEYACERIEYCIKQSVKLRTVFCDEDSVLIPVANDFIERAEACYNEQGNKRKLFSVVPKAC